MKVFVYGTLREGEANAGFLKGAVKLGKERLAEGYMLYSLGTYPGAITLPDGGPLWGEVYRINACILRALDWLEDYPVEYDRVEISTSYGKAWIYLYNPPVSDLPVIESGDWCQRID
ncbi:gamma-glutamylcyclotransferase family protein [Photobacterium sp. DNB23_23_1]